MEKLIQSDYDLIQEALSSHGENIRRKEAMTSHPLMGSVSKLFGGEFEEFRQKEQDKDRNKQEDIQLLKAKLILIKRQEMSANEGGSQA